MVYTFLISVVFIAELIIFLTIVFNLIKLDKAILNLDEILVSSKQNFREIAILIRKISEQIVELSHDSVEKFKRDQEDRLLKNISKILMSLFLWKINIKAVNKFRRSKLAKTLAKGFSLLEIVV